MNAKAIIPLVAGLGIGGLALKIGIDKINSAQGAVEPTVRVWVPRETAAIGVEVVEDNLVALEFPKKLVPEAAILEKENIIGRVPKTDIPAGLPFLETTLLAPGERAGLHVPQGYRAVAVKVDAGSGVDNHLRPGARVDVIGFFQIQRKSKRETVARPIIENVEVGAVGPWISPSRGNGGENGPKRPARAVVLFVRPEKVAYLHLAEQRGKIKLSMRNAKDGGRIDSKSLDVFESDVLGQKEEPEPMPVVVQVAPQPKAEPVPIVEPEPEPEPYEVVVWNSNTREVMKFENAASTRPATRRPASENDKKWDPEPQALPKNEGGEPKSPAKIDAGEPEIKTSSAESKAEDE